MPENPIQKETDDAQEQLLRPASSSLPSYLQQQKITMGDIRKHISGPLISVLFHIVALILIGTLIVIDGPQKEPNEVQIEIKDMEVVKQVDPPKPDPQETPDEVDPTQFSDAVIDRPTVTNDTVSSEVADVSTSNALQDVDIPLVPSFEVSNSSLQLPGLMFNRTESGIKDSLKRYGGSGKGEQAVLRALTWLASVQNEDGSWGDNGSASPAAMTAVATLTFLAHGEKPESPKFGPTVAKALKRLCAFAATQRSPTSVIMDKNTSGYSHAMVAYAVSEGYAMTKLPMLETAMNNLINSIVQGQNELGGYGYGFEKTPAVLDPQTGKFKGGYAQVAGDFRCDLSVGGWNYQALKAAAAAGCKVEGLHEAIERGAKCIKTINKGIDGTFTYENSRGKKSGTIAMTSVGTLCLQLFGDGRSAEAQMGMRTIENFQYKKPSNPKKPDDVTLVMNWDNPPPQASMPLYTWYYMTQAIFQGTQGTGRVWNKWNRSFRDELVKQQSKIGYWDSPSVHKNSGDPKASQKDGSHSLDTELSQRIWSTSMCAMMLEVYYRFLPTFKNVEQKAPVHNVSDGADDDDISLED